MCRHVTPNVSRQFPLIIQLRCNEFVEYEVEPAKQTKEAENYESVHAFRQQSTSVLNFPT